MPEPRPRLLQFVRREEFHRGGTDAGAGKSECEHFPAGVDDDRDPGNASAMREKEVEVVPIRAPFPSVELIENGEDARPGAGVNFLRDGRLGGGELVAREYSSHSKDANVPGFEFDGR